MAFSLGISSFFADRYYTYLEEAYGERGRLAFEHAFHYYAMQRGRRRAQRAIHDGLPLTYETYLQYPENMPNEVTQRVDRPGRSEKIIEGARQVSHVFACPVHDKFAEMKTDPKISVFYCSHIDVYEAEGFNPEIRYYIDQTLNTADYCLHRVENANLTPGKELPKHTESTPPFPYICANYFFSIRECILAIFGEEADAIAERVKRDFIEEYGLAEWEEVERYKNCNFNVRYIPGSGNKG